MCVGVGLEKGCEIGGCGWGVRREIVVGGG